MTIETGRYCSYCTDSTGALQYFDERFERMVAWQARKEPEASRADLEASTLAYMSTMPVARPPAGHRRAQLKRRTTPPIGSEPTASQPYGVGHAIPLSDVIPAGSGWAAHVVPPSVERTATTAGSAKAAAEVLAVACAPTASQTEGVGQAMALRAPTEVGSLVLTHLAPPSVVRSAYG
jgi:hypothetical protein